MELDYQKMIDDQVYQKLNKLTINEIRIVINQLQLEYKRAYSSNFYKNFVTNVRKNNEDAVYSLYVNDLNRNFNNEYIEQLKPLAQRYQKNQLKQAIRKKVNLTFDENFKARYQTLIKLIAKQTLQATPF